MACVTQVAGSGVPLSGCRQVASLRCRNESAYGSPANRTTYSYVTPGEQIPLISEITSQPTPEYRTDRGLDPESQIGPARETVKTFITARAAGDVAKALSVLESAQGLASAGLQGSFPGRGIDVPTLEVTGDPGSYRVFVPTDALNHLSVASPGCPLRARLAEFATHGERASRDLSAVLGRGATGLHLRGPDWWEFSADSTSTLLDALPSGQA